MITVCTVRRVSRVQFLDILLCKSAIRRLFFPSCSLAVFCTLSPLFVPFGLDSGFRLLCVRLAVHVHFAFVVWAGDACLLSGNPKIRNREREPGTGKKPKTRIRKPLIKENKFFKYVKIYCAEFLPFKKQENKEKSPQTKTPCLLKFVQP